MLKLTDWIVDSRFVKMYFGWSPEFAKIAASGTRSAAVQGTTRLRMFSAFVWKI